jgi:hypothetical protein
MDKRHRVLKRQISVDTIRSRSEVTQCELVCQLRLISMAGMGFEACFACVSSFRAFTNELISESPCTRVFLGRQSKEMLV